MADDEKPKSEPHLQPFKRRAFPIAPLPPPEPGSLASEEHRRLMREGLPSMRDLMMEANAEAAEPALGPPPKRVMGFTELLDTPGPSQDWLIPGLLEREDRVIITGDEGYGKSTLLRQIGLCAALGENPLSTEPITTHSPLTTLLVDLENSHNQIRTESYRLRPKIPPELADRVNTHFRLYVETAGLSLDDPIDRDSDRELLEKLLAEVRPDLLIIGPLYKMMGRGDPNDEKDARTLARFLDVLRGEYRFGLIIEAHAPHNQKRPYGWSGWKRWPEIGIHLNAIGEISHWRGARGERSWPAKLLRGRRDTWPWVPSGADTGPTARDAHSERLAQIQLEVQRLLREHRAPMTKTQIVERLGRNRNQAFAAIARLKDSRALVVDRTLKTTDAQGKSRTTELLGLNTESEPDWRGIESPNPRGSQYADIRHLPGFSEGNDEPKDDE